MPPQGVGRRLSPSVLVRHAPHVPVPVPRRDHPLDGADDGPIPALLGASFDDLCALEQARIANVRAPLLPVDILLFHTISVRPPKQPH